MFFFRKSRGQSNKIVSLKNRIKILKLDPARNILENLKNILNTIETKMRKIGNALLDQFITFSFLCVLLLSNF